MLTILLQTKDLKERFESAHCVQIVSVTSNSTINMALINVWITDEYKSIEQVVIYFNGTEIIDVHDIAEKGVRWKCIYGLENSKYWLGSDYSSLNSGAILALFKDHFRLTSRSFDKGYGTEIIRMDTGNDDAIIIEGNWYKCERAGGHDDFWPQKWVIKISKDGYDFVEKDNPLFTESYFEDFITDSGSDTFYFIENYGVSKYTNDGKLLWNQGLGHIKKEYLMALNKMAPYNKTQNGITFADGVWFSGMDTTHSERSLGKPILGRVTAAGTILSFEEQLSNFPEIHKIHKIIPGQDSNCLLVCETLHVGKGSGLCLLSIHFSLTVCTMYIKYLNFSTNDLKLSVSDYSWFHERYVEIKEIYSQGSCFEDLKEIIIFGNVNHLRNRDNGMVWSIKTDFINNPLL